MGVPAFFRWLSRKYPSIVVHCIEEKGKIIDGVKIPPDSSQPNPNNVEFDNLYLDMNGIIHPCCHPENKPAPKNEDEMMVAIFEYIDRIFTIVRPRRLLYMAIDGVAPRAKMNQQRSRRFRASKESVEKVETIAKIRSELMAKGASLPPEKPKEEHFDSNCITPGTPFMARLAKCLHYYIHDRLNNDPGWRNIEVILSDANVPGEGEHKIMDYIRRQRSNPSHDPNTHHCLCGADADLIMLGLATHEPNFTIIREEFKPNQPKPCDICGQIGHEMQECTGTAKEKQGEHDELEKPMDMETEFIFIRLNVLREYLEKDLTMHHLPFPFDLERVIDDWVFMCFFVGNDFLPHLPSLEIREGAIDRLVNLYKKAVYKTGGFLTDSGRVNLSRVQLILTDLGEVEDEIFKRRQENEISFRQRMKEKKKRMKLMNDKPAWIPGGQLAPTPLGSNPAPVQNVRLEAYQMRMQAIAYQSSNNEKSGQNQNSRSSTGDKRKHGSDESSDEEPQDDVRLWEDGWKDRYYAVKFEVDAENYQFRHTVGAAYVEGLCWVLRYYYQGCASWKWFFPYHYAPFASDFVNVGDLPTEFEKGTSPFKPLEQLMGVFPAASKQHLPDPWAELMCDPESSIIDFYPDDFKIDLNGKKFAWQGVALLPFVDEKRLLNALKDVYPLLSDEEKKRNVRGDDRIYIRKGHSGYDFFLGLYEGRSDYEREYDINPDLFNGIGGTVLLSEEAVGPDEILESPVVGLPPLGHNATVCVRFRDPKYQGDFIFPARRLPGARDPQRVLKPGDLSQEQNRGWRPQIGMAPANKRASLDISGKRMLDRNMGHHSGGYSQVPPPNQYGRGSHFNSYNAPRSGGQQSFSSNKYNDPKPFLSWQQQQQSSQYSSPGSDSGYFQQHSSSSNFPKRSRWSNNDRQSDDRPGNDRQGSRQSSNNSSSRWGPVQPTQQPSSGFISLYSSPSQSSSGTWGPVDPSGSRNWDRNSSSRGSSDYGFQNRDDRNQNERNNYASNRPRGQQYSHTSHEYSQQSQRYPQQSQRYPSQQSQQFPQEPEPFPYQSQISQYSQKPSSSYYQR